MGDNDNLARDVGEVRATLASELGRLKGDFLALSERVEKYREQLASLQQASSLVSQLDTKLQQALSEINSVIHKIDSLERAGTTTEKYVDREIQHVRSEIKQEIAKAVLELDLSISTRFPATTIHDQIEELFNLSHKASESMQRILADHDGDRLSSYKEQTDRRLKSIEDKHETLSTSVTDQKIALSNSSIKLSILIAVLGIILQLVTTQVVKYLFESKTQNAIPTTNVKN